MRSARTARVLRGVGDSGGGGTGGTAKSCAAGRGIAPTLSAHGARRISPPPGPGAFHLRRVIGIQHFRPGVGCARDLHRGEQCFLRAQVLALLASSRMDAQGEDHPDRVSVRVDAPTGLKAHRIEAPFGGITSSRRSARTSVCRHLGTRSTCCVHTRRAARCSKGKSEQRAALMLITVHARLHVRSVTVCAAMLLRDRASPHARAASARLDEF